MKIILALVLAFILVSSTPVVHAQDNLNISIYMDKYIYGYNETVSPTISVDNNGDTPFVGTFVGKITNVSGISSSFTQYGPKFITIQPKSEINLTEFSLKTIPPVASGEYKVVAEVHYADSFIVKEKNFTITGIPMLLEYSVSTCKDIGCNSITTIFHKGENVFIVPSDGQATYSGSYETPSGAIQTLQFSQGASQITANEIGTYTVIVNAEKSGFSSVEKTIQFGVIEKEPQIGNFFEAGSTSNNQTLLLIGIAAGAAVIAIIAYLRLRKPSDPYEQLKKSLERRE